MTALSTLVGGAGGGFDPFQSNKPFWAFAPNNLAATSNRNNYDILLPFTPVADVTIDQVCWYRVDATAANVYVGIYDNDGNLLTDCAVDADTTVGVHEVSTTSVALTGGTTYYLAINHSATCACGDSAGTYTDIENSPIFRGFLEGNQPDTKWYASGTFPANGFRMAIGFEKARTAAALPSTQTTSGWAAQGRIYLMGVTPV